MTCPVRAVAEEDPAITAARKRQEAVTTLAIEFKVTEIIPRGGISKVLMPPFNQPLPPNDTTFETDNRCVIDRDKIRYEHNHGHHFKANRQPMQLRKVSVYDGSSMTIYFKGGIQPSDGDAGVLNAQQRDFGSPVSDPIVYAFRAQSPQFVPSRMTEMRPTGANIFIDGARCEEYVSQRIGIQPPSQTTSTYYLDPAKHYVARRIQSKRPGGISHQQDINYRQDDARRWVPISWESKEYSADGDLRGTIKVDVTMLRINEPVAETEFQVKFPVGSWITDQQNDDEKTYQVQPDGSLREYDRASAMALHVTAAGPAHWYQNKWLLIGAAAVLAVGFGGAYLWRRKKVYSTERLD
jgi:hypothetical protein